MKSCEQQARDMLERMGFEGAQQMSAGDLVELANIINDAHKPTEDDAGQMLKTIDDLAAHLAPEELKIAEIPIHLYECVTCRAPIDIGPDKWKAVGETFVCPNCGAKNYFYTDEDADCNYWFAFELADK